MRNIELLDKIIAKIEAEPESWNQGRWAIGSGENAFRDDNGHLQPGPECNTAFCVAGHVAVETGAKFNWMRYGVRIEIEAHHVVGENGHLQSIDNYAKEKLGLTQSEADDLFDLYNSLDQIKEMRDIFVLRNEDGYEYGS